MASTVTLNPNPTRVSWPPLLFASGGSLVVLLYASNVFGPLEPDIFVVVGIATFAAIVAGLRMYRPVPMWPWLTIIGALTLFLIGGAARVDYNTLGNLTASRSLLPDAFAIPGYLLLAVGLTRLARIRDDGNGTNVDMVLEALVATLALFACAWVFMIDPILFHKGVPLDVRVMLSCYPPLSLFLVMIAFRIGFDPSQRRSTASKYLLAAMLFMLAGDIIYMFADLRVISVPSSLIDLPYLMAFVLFGAMVLHPSMATLADRPARPSPTAKPAVGRLALVAIALVIPAAIIGGIQQRGLSDRLAVAVIVVALTCAAAIRLFRALRASSRAAAETAYRATHDSLTGLPNRSLIEDRLNELLQSPAARNVAILFLDVDRFKDANDTFGHSFGDELLVQVAERIKRTVRDADLVGRMSGDEFVVVLDGPSDLSIAEEAAERVRRSFSDPFSVRHSKTHVFASVGVAFSQSNDPVTRMTDAEMMIGDADNAMYQAKQAGRNAVAVFDTTMRDQVAARRSIEEDLQEAVARHQFTLDYQPIVDLVQGGVRSFEALIRWSRGPDEVVSPMTFIPVAEQTGLILDIGAWVIDEACSKLANWRQTVDGAEELNVSVNVSAPQLRDPDLVRVVSGALLKNDLPGHALTIELTETVLMDNLQTSLEVLGSCGRWASGSRSTTSGRGTARSPT